MELLSIFGFSLALSLDGFGAGTAYGIRRIKIPLHCLLLINFTSCAALAIAMAGGHIMARYIDTALSQWIGAAILIAVGIWTVFQTWFQRNDEKENLISEKEIASDNQNCQQDKKVLEVKIKSFGFVIQIFREPLKADIDASGFLSTKESFLLGMALAMDALGAGFGLSMSGFRPWLAPVIVGLVQFIMVKSGVYIGRKYCAGWLGKKAAILPGWILILIGISRVLKL